MDHELPGTDEPRDAAAERLDGGIGDCEKDERRVADALELRLPASLLGPVPEQDDTEARGAQGRGQHLTYGAAAQHGSGAKRSRHPSSRNSTPDGVAQATSCAPFRIRPARISSARGDSTRRWIVWRIGRAPSEASHPPCAMR